MSRAPKVESEGTSLSVDVVGDLVLVVVKRPKNEPPYRLGLSRANAVDFFERVLARLRAETDEF